MIFFLKRAYALDEIQPQIRRPSIAVSTRPHSPPSLDGFVGTHPALHPASVDPRPTLALARRPPPGLPTVHPPASPAFRPRSAPARLPSARHWPPSFRRPLPSKPVACRLPPAALGLRSPRPVALPPCTTGEGSQNAGIIGLTCKSDDDCKRVGNESESEGIRCIRCAFLVKEKKDLQSRLADVVSTEDFEALIAHVKMLEEEKELLRLNLKEAEEEVIILSYENCRLEEKNKSLSKKYKKKQRECSNGTQSKSISAKSKRECKSKISKVFDARVLDFNDSESPRQPLLPIQNNSPESRSSKK